MRVQGLPRTVLQVKPVLGHAMHALHTYIHSMPLPVHEVVGKCWFACLSLETWLVPCLKDSDASAKWENLKLTGTIFKYRNKPSSQKTDPPHRLAHREIDVLASNNTLFSEDGTTPSYEPVPWIFRDIHISKLNSYNIAKQQGTEVFLSFTPSFSVFSFSQPVLFYTFPTLIFPFSSSLLLVISLRHSKHPGFENSFLVKNYDTILMY